MVYWRRQHFQNRHSERFNPRISIRALPCEQLLCHNSATPSNANVSGQSSRTDILRVEGRPPSRPDSTTVAGSARGRFPCGEASLSSDPDFVPLCSIGVRLRRGLWVNGGGRGFEVHWRWCTGDGNIVKIVIRRDSTLEFRFVHFLANICSATTQRRHPQKTVGINLSEWTF